MILGYEHGRAVDFYTLGCLIYEMIVGFPPFHSQNSKTLEKRIVSGVVRFPMNVDPDARDLIEWLLATDPNERPQEFSEVKTHPFFNEIHWGRVAKKEAIPPWIPDLYTCHSPKKLGQIPLSQVFMKNTYHKECQRASYNNRHKNEEFKNNLYVYDQNSNREVRKMAEKIGQTVEEILHLEGFDYNFESADEEAVRVQLEAEKYKIKLSDIAPMDKTLKTKCTENAFVSEDCDINDENCSIDSEGGITPMQKYNYTKNILSKNKTYNGMEPLPLELKSCRSAHKGKRATNIKFKMRDFGRMNDSWSSRNTHMNRSNISNHLHANKSREL